MKTISVLIYNRNHSRAATKTARSLTKRRAATSSGLKIDLTVVDDGSDPTDRRALEALPGAVERLFYPTRRGLGTVINRYLEGSNHDGLLVLMPWISVDPATIESCGSLAASDATLAAVSPTLLAQTTDACGEIPLWSPNPEAILSGEMSPSERASRVKQALWNAARAWSEGGGRSGQEETLSPSCFLIKRSAYDQIGAFDETLSHGFELLEWIHRAKKSGLRCLAQTPPKGRIATEESLRNLTHDHDPLEELPASWLKAASRFAQKTGAPSTSGSNSATAESASSSAPSNRIPRQDLGEATSPPDLGEEVANSLFILARTATFQHPVLACTGNTSTLANLWTTFPEGHLYLDAINTSPSAAPLVASISFRKQLQSAPEEQPRDRATSTDASSALETWEVDIYRKGDETAICECFERVFNTPKPLDIWNWQFRDNPAGIRVFVARTPSGRVVAQFAGLPVRMTLGGEDHIFTQMVDNMVDPDYRQGLRRKGVFSEVVYRYVDHFGNPEGETVGFGLPNPQAYRIGRRLLGYSLIQDVYDTSRILSGEDAQREEVVPTGVRVEVSEDPPGDADELFATLRPNYPLTIIRDVAYLRWRYTQSPFARFKFVTARREDGSGPSGEGSLLGYAVLRISYLEDPGTSAIVDWLTVEDNLGADRAIVRRCEKIAIEHGGGKIVSFFPVDRKEVRLLQSLDYTTEKSNWLLVGRTYHPDVTLSWVGKHWYYTLGEFDLV